MVFNVRVQRPQSVAGRLWNRAQDVSPIVPLTFIVLKLAGVITWSWWWVLSPLWISGILIVVALCALLVLLRWEARRQARLWLEQLARDLAWDSFRNFISDLAGRAYPDASGGDPGSQHGGGHGASPPDG